MAHARTSLDRMARITRFKLSFSSVIILELAFGHLKSTNTGLRYNGDGYRGDLRAIGSDFNIGIHRARRLVSSGTGV